MNNKKNDLRSLVDNMEVKLNIEPAVYTIEKKDKGINIKIDNSEFRRKREPGNLEIYISLKNKQKIKIEFDYQECSILAYKVSRSSYKSSFIYKFLMWWYDIKFDIEKIENRKLY